MAQLGCRVLTRPDDLVEVSPIMRGVEPEVFDAVYAAVEPLLPVPPMTHPLAVTAVGYRTAFACRRCSFASSPAAWVDVEARVVRWSLTPPRGRRDEWEGAGVFDVLAEEALTAYDLSSVSTCPRRRRRLAAQGTPRWRGHRAQPG